jgi:hypothetical protein
VQAWPSRRIEALKIGFADGYTPKVELRPVEADVLTPVKPLRARRHSYGPRKKKKKERADKRREWTRGAERPRPTSS